MTRHNFHGFRFPAILNSFRVAVNHAESRFIAGLVTFVCVVGATFKAIDVGKDGTLMTICHGKTV